MSSLEWFFWSCVAVVAYTYIFYPIILVILNQLPRGGGGSPAQQSPRSVTVLLPVHNEEHNLPRRLEELTRMLAANGAPGEIIVISDASTDRSADVARQHGAHV